MSRPNTYIPTVRDSAERSLGILERRYYGETRWVGDIRKRYTDFVVNELAKDGTTVHLLEYEVTEPTAAQQSSLSLAGLNSTTPAGRQPKVQIVSETDRNSLKQFIGDDDASRLVNLDLLVQLKSKIPFSERSVVLKKIQDRAVRAKVHQEIRRIFSSRLETVTDNAGSITASPSHATRKPGNNRRAPTIVAPGEGSFLHFSMYKENKDTMDAINTIARLLKIKASNFGFAGTKDRRAATVQRISVHNQYANQLTWLNAKIPTVKVGGFKYETRALELGDHGGNEFIITVKNCHQVGVTHHSLLERFKAVQTAVDSSLNHMHKYGYLNYYGLQRFGTYHIGTHQLGMKLLKGDFEGVCEDILHVDDALVQEILRVGLHNPQDHALSDSHNRDDLGRARGIMVWKMTRNVSAAIPHIPKRFSSEIAIITELGRDPRNFVGAIMAITRGMRTMYTHAYQSYVWNYVMTYRWKKYGTAVAEGDLILLNKDNEAGGDEDDPFPMARALTADDIATNKYTIYDVVLPCPGFDVMYPINDVGDYYKSFMEEEANGGLDPYNMRRRQREFSLSGCYRYIIGRFINEPQYAVCTYHDDTEQLCPTDMDYCTEKLRKGKVPAADVDHAKSSSDLTGSSPPVPSKTEAANGSDRLGLVGRPSSLWDDALNARRRKASASPQSDTQSHVQGSWVQTGLEDTDKRAKVAHHTFEADTGARDVNSYPDHAPVFTPESSLASTEAHEASSRVDISILAPYLARLDKTFVQAPVAGPAATRQARLSISCSNDARFDSGVPLAPFYSTAKKEVAHAGSNEESSLTASAMRNAASGPSALYGTESDAMASPAALALVSDALSVTSHKDFSSTASVNAAFPSTNGAPIAAAMTTGTVAKKETPEVVAGIKVPELRVPSDDTTVPLPSMQTRSPLDNKVAVILKFQLKMSNYATIVLRELMGDPNEDESLAIMPPFGANA